MINKKIIIASIIIMILSITTCKKDETTETSSPKDTVTIERENEKKKQTKTKKIKKEFKGDVKKLEEIQEIELEKNLDLSNTTVNYFDIKSVDTTEMQKVDDDTELTIVDYGPQGAISSRVKDPTIFVLFSKPMVPLSKLGEPLKSSKIMSIEPELDGVFRWHGSKMLSFIPDKAFEPQHIYTVTINGNTKALGGKKLGEDFTFTFNTEFLDIQSMSPSGSNIPLDRAQKITLTFKYPVDMDVITPFITIECNGAGYDFTASRLEKNAQYNREFIDKTIVLNVKEHFPENSRVTVTLKKGAKSHKEYLGTTKDLNRSFSTLTPFLYRQYSTYTYSFPAGKKGDSNPIYLNFSHPVDEKTVAANIEVSLDIADIQDHIEVWGRTVKLTNLPVVYDSFYQVIIKEGLGDTYGRKLNAQKKFDVEVKGARRYAYFPNQGTKILEAAFNPPKIAYEYQNVFDGMWKAMSINEPYSSYNESLVPYDFTGLEKNVKRYDTLDLSPWLNSSGKGYVYLAWNFEPKQLPKTLSRTEYDDMVTQLAAEMIVDDFKGIYYMTDRGEYRLDDTYNNRGTRNKVQKYLTDKYNYMLKPYQYGIRSLNLQVTDLAVTTRIAYNKVVVLVSSLSTGSPVAGAKVYLKKYDQNNTMAQFTGETDRDGITTFELTSAQYAGLTSIYSPFPQIGVVKGDDKVDFYPNYSHNRSHFGIYDTTSPRKAYEKRYHTFLFTDRGLYKPGETVTFRGISRSLKKGEYSPYAGNYTIQVKNTKYRYNAKPIKTITGRCSESGGLYGTFDLSDDLEPGYYDIEYVGDGKRQTCRFQVAYFRRLNFQVGITKPDVTYYKDDTISMNVGADYLSGGVMSGANFNYYWVKESSSFKPTGTNWAAYRFGPDEYDNPGTIDSGRGTLNNLGQFDLKYITKTNDKRGLPYRYTLNVQVEDVDRQVIQSRKSTVVHPAAFYIGAKFASNKDGWWSPFVKKGESFEAEYTLVRPDGTIYDTFKKDSTLKVRLMNIDWSRAEQQGVYGYINSRYERREIVEYEDEIPVDDVSGKIKLKTQKCGMYILEFSGMDNNNREAVTRVEFYSTGSDWFNWGSANVSDINLVADKQSYKPGETIKLLVKSPLPKGKYLVTLEREGIFTEKVYDLEGAANLIEIPIEEAYVPVFYISIASYSVRDKDPPASYKEPDLGKPKAYFGVTRIMVDTDSREIVLDIIPSQSSYLPGVESEVTIVASRDGMPVSDAEITFLAVDRGVLDLINYHVPDPLKFFYDPAKFPLGVDGGDSRSLLIDPVTYETKDLHGGDGDSKIKKRKDFRPTAVFEPFLKTDEKGEVTVRFTLPDTLTTYRCTAIAVNKDRFGIQENEIKVQNPINVRTALPRRMRIRDTAFAGVVVMNLDAKEHDVTVSLESDILIVEGESSQTITLPANSRVEIPFKIVALQEGEATVTFRTISDILKEELEEKLIVERPIVKEAFTSIGETKPTKDEKNKTSATEGLLIPTNIGKGFGGVTVRLDATKITNLAESINYLFDYPYGCLEQRSSKIFPLIVFGDLVKPFINEDNPVKIVEDELKYWARFQNSDGGFPYWPKGGYHSSLYISIKIAKCLYYAKSNNIAIPSSIRVQDLLNYISRYDDKKTGNYLKLYSLYAQSLHGRNVLLKANEIYESSNELSLTSYAFLGLIYYYNNEPGTAKECLKKIKNQIKTGTQTIDIVEPNNRYYFSTDINDYSLVIMLFDLIDPDNPLIRKTVNTLMQRQGKGYWLNTVATEWVIQAFHQLYQKESGEKTDFTAVVSVDNKDLAETTFKGAINKTYVKELGFDDALKDVPRNKTVPLTFNTEGTGTLYYAATIKYALPYEVVLPRDEGFNVYAEVTDPEGNPLKDTKHLTLGKIYKMKLMVSSNRRRQYVAVRAPIPSGAEILDSSFVTTAGLIPEKNTKNSNDYDYYYYEPWWYEPLQFIYDNEVRYFFNYFPEGKKEMEFLFRITTPGIYPTPPVTVECMYEEEVFGRTNGKLHVVMPE